MGLRPPITFERADYLRYVRELKLEREVVPASEQPAHCPYLALQHDVDLSLRWAHDMAGAEYAFGIRSAYFVLVGSDFYDVLSAESQRLLKDMRQMDHVIGLHFDCRRYEDARVDLLDGIARDIEVLRIASGYDVDTVCAHKPLRNGFHTEKLVEHGIRTPQREGEIYVSDSARGFRDRSVGYLAHPPRRLRINLHPCWYRGLDRGDTVIRASGVLKHRIDSATLDWLTMDDHPNAREHDARRKATA